MADKTLPEQIADTVRRDILRGVYLPGHPIKERDTSAALGVSRTPLREAVRILAREGLVILRPARSPLVADPSLKEVTDAIAVLRTLEVLSGELACAEATDQEIAGIRTIHQRIGDSFETLDPLDLFEIDMSFHIAIAQASHNPALAETHGDYLARLWRIRFLSARMRRSRERIMRQHGAIVDALETRDASRARDAIDAHLLDLLANVERCFARETSKEGHE